MLEDEQKKIITYHRIWFVRLIAMIVACQALKQLIGASHCGEKNIHLGLLFTRSMPDFAIWMILLKCMVQISG